MIAVHGDLLSILVAGAFYYLFSYEDFSLYDFVSWLPADQCFPRKFYTTLRAFYISSGIILKDFVFKALNQTSCSPLLVLIQKRFTLSTVDFDCVVWSHFLFPEIPISKSLMWLVTKLEW